jgi:hypothetical protein
MIVMHDRNTRSLANSTVPLLFFCNIITACLMMIWNYYTVLLLPPPLSQSYMFHGAVNYNEYLDEWDVSKGKDFVSVLVDIGVCVATIAAYFHRVLRTDEAPASILPLLLHCRGCCAVGSCITR